MNDMTSTHPIGGYLPWEMTQAELPDPNAYPVNLGRTGLELILERRRYRRVWLPAYICTVVFETLKKRKLDYATYSIDRDFEPVIDCALDDDEALLYVNYFGLMDGKLAATASRFRNVILDLTQAFFCVPPDGIDAFSSARKFIGVPDGGFLFSQFAPEIDLPRQLCHDYCKHLLMRAEGLTEEGYPFFCENDAAMKSWDCRRMSLISEKIVSSAPLSEIAEKRRDNFRFLHDRFGAVNELKWELNNCVPLCYPLLIRDGAHWKKKLCEAKIFVPTYWPHLESLLVENSFEWRLIRDLVCLPIDQNCNLDDMRRVADFMGDVENAAT